MNNVVKKALIYGLIPLLILVFVVVKGLSTPVKVELDLEYFSGIEFREGTGFALDWDEEREMTAMESESFEIGQELLYVGINAPEAANLLLVQLNEDWEEFEEAAFELVEGRQELQIPLSPDAVTIKVLVSDENTGIIYIELVKDTGFNVREGLFWALCLFGIYTLLVCYRFISKKPEYGFLIAAVCIMAVFFVWMPLTVENIWDGEIHRATAEKLAHIGRGAPVAEGLASLVFSDVGYIPGAIGMRIAELFTDEANPILFCVHLANALTYIAACFFAVKSAVRYKMIFAIGALMPTAMFLANSSSYDMMVNGFMYLFFALLITQMLTPDQKITAGQAAALMGALILACAPKAVYVPIALFLLFLPKTKFASKKQHITFNLAVGLVFVAIASTFVLPILIDTGSFAGDTRGGDVNPSAQMAFILSNPIAYAGYLLNNIYNSLQFWLFNMASIFAYRGGASPSLSLCLLLLLAYTGLTDVPDVSKNVPELRGWRKAVLFLCFAATVALICTSMFIAFTEVGASGIAGVQPRYFLALIPIMLALLQPSFIAKTKPGKLYQSGVLIAVVIMNFVMINNVLMG